MSRSGRSILILLPALAAIVSCSGPGEPPPAQEEQQPPAAAEPAPGRTPLESSVPAPAPEETAGEIPTDTGTTGPPPATPVPTPPVRPPKPTPPLEATPPPGTPTPSPTAAPAPRPTATPEPAATPTPPPSAAPPAPPRSGVVEVTPTKEGLARIGAEKCKICHRVQYDSWATSSHAARTPPLDCESCHGPGSEYKSMTVMKDPEQARQAGLVMPPESFCTENCHATDWQDEMLAQAHAHKAD